MISKPGGKHNEDFTGEVPLSTDNRVQRVIHKIIITSGNKIT